VCVCVCQWVVCPLEVFVQPSGNRRQRGVNNPPASSLPKLNLNSANQRWAFWEIYNVTHTHTHTHFAVQLCKSCEGKFMQRIQVKVELLSCLPVDMRAHGHGQPHTQSVHCRG